jgi:hypothetical protein
MIAKAQQSILAIAKPSFKKPRLITLQGVIGCFPDNFALKQYLRGNVVYFFCPASIRTYALNLAI